VNNGRGPGTGKLKVLAGGDGARDLAGVELLRREFGAAERGVPGLASWAGMSDPGGEQDALAPKGRGSPLPQTQLPCGRAVG
jgi:hypothetical protein